MYTLWCKSSKWVRSTGMRYPFQMKYVTSMKYAYYRLKISYSLSFSLSLDPEVSWDDLENLLLELMFLSHHGYYVLTVNCNVILALSQHCHSVIIMTMQPLKLNVYPFITKRLWLTHLTTPVLHFSFNIVATSLEHVPAEVLHEGLGLEVQ